MHPGRAPPPSAREDHRPHPQGTDLCGHGRPQWGAPHRPGASGAGGDSQPLGNWGGCGGHQGNEKGIMQNKDKL